MKFKRVVVIIGCLWTTKARLCRTSIQISELKILMLKLLYQHHWKNAAHIAAYILKWICKFLSIKPKSSSKEPRKRFFLFESNAARKIHAFLVTLIFKNWKYICLRYGRDFEKKDFKTKAIFSQHVAFTPANIPLRKRARFQSKMKSFPLAPPLSGELSARFSPSDTPKANSTAFSSPKNATCLGCIYTASKIAESRPRSTQLRTFSKRSEKIGSISAKRWKKQSKQNASSPNIKAIGNQFVKNFSSRFPRREAAHLNFSFNFVLFWKFNIYKTL